MHASSHLDPSPNDVRSARFANDDDPGGARTATLRGGAVTHVGLIRTRNEDAWLARPDTGLFVVCDGMGGHLAGDVASQLAIETIAASTADLAPADDVAERLSRAIWRANRDVFLAGRVPQFAGMGTTAAALWLGETRGVVAHVGDSRVYRHRGDRLTALTLDHSPVGDAVRRGQLDRATAETIAASPIVTRSLGASVDVHVELTELELRRGDRYLLCTDGLSDLVPSAHLHATLASQLTPDDAAERLVLMALDRGGYDNVTALVVDVL